MLENTDKFSDEYRLQHLEFMMDKYGEEIKRLIYSYVKDYSIIDNITQETFINFYTNFHKFQYKSDVKTWLYRIAINKCKDYLRSSKRKYLLIINFFNDRKNEPEENIIQKQRNDILINKIMNLPIKYRELIILHYYKDLSIAEISIVLNLNENTIKTRLKRARHKLKEQMTEERGEKSADK